MVSDNEELSRLGWLQRWSFEPDGTLHRGNGEGDTSSLEELGALGGLRECWADVDLGRRWRMEENKEEESRRGNVPMPLSNIRILQPEPEAEGKNMMGLGDAGVTHKWKNLNRMTCFHIIS